MVEKQKENNENQEAVVYCLTHTDEVINSLQEIGKFLELLFATMTEEEVNKHG